ncbi:MAG TPA: cupin domain-containing protein [Casimicrobiaceae bacterium]|nr:cupin domain-containing protein [Casimicrobiaceae bacterium]
MGNPRELTLTGPATEAALHEMYAEIAARNMFPFWAKSSDVEHDDIRQLMSGPKPVPFRWSYRDDIEPLLFRSAQLITTEDTDRRSLVLINPGLAPRRASVSTLYTAYRVNEPNEIMPPHRHTASAIRFGLTGNRNFTGVEGEDITFCPGDMVLTPRDTWHNHGNMGDEPAINLSVLDYPLVENLNALAFDHDYREGGVAKRKQSPRFPTDYSSRVYGSGGLRPRFVDHFRGVGGSSPMYVYRYEPMRELLEKHRNFAENPHEGLLIEYVDPLTGGPVYKTMTFFMQMVRKGETTLPMKQSASLLVAPFEGNGHAQVDGGRFALERFDTLAIPGGHWVEYANDGDDPLILFVASDEPALAAFGLLTRYGRSAGGDVVKLV